MATNADKELFQLRIGSVGLVVGSVASVSASQACEFSTSDLGMFGWGAVSGIPLGLALGAISVLIQMIWVKLSRAFTLWPASRLWFGPVLTALIGAVVGLYTFSRCTPEARLRKLIGEEAQHAGTDIKVSGFNSFLACRWYARFSLPNNAISRLLRSKGLTNQVGPEQLESLRRQSPYGAIATAAGTVPAWPAAVIWHRDSGDPAPGSQSVSWSWLAVDSTGTNCFYTWGYQN